MAQQNDSINQQIPQNVHDAMNHTALEIIKVLKVAGMDVEGQIDHHPSTGEVQMTERTFKAINAFKKELTAENIIIDKIAYNENPAASGYYVIRGRKVQGGVILDEGTVLGFVPMTPVEAAVTYGDGEKAAGVMV